MSLTTNFDYEAVYQKHREEDHGLQQVLSAHRHVLDDVHKNKYPDLMFAISLVSSKRRAWG